MTTKMIRISDRTRSALLELASDSGESMQQVLARAVEAYRAQRLLERTNEAYARLRNSPDLWKEELEERALWERTLADGLEDL
jgi:predicted transcriptional regulator